MEKNFCFRIVSILVCLLCLISFTACASNNNDENLINRDNHNNTENSDVNSSETNNEKQTASMIRVPSIQMGSINSIIYLLNNYDINNYREEFREKYQEMFSLLKEPGFIYQISVTNNAQDNDAIVWLEVDGENVFFLTPYAKYEDIGIKSNVTFRGVIYQVRVHVADAKFLTTEQSTSEYMENRLSRTCLEEMIIGENTICFATESGKNCAISFIDDSHYYIVTGDGTQDELIDFINAMSFEKVLIE